MDIGGYMPALVTARRALASDLPPARHPLAIPCQWVPTRLPCVPGRRQQSRGMVSHGDHGQQCWPLALSHHRLGKRAMALRDKAPG